MEFDWLTFLDAIGLVFIVEGIMPFIRPESFRRYLEAMQRQPDHQIRLMGFISMIFGVVILYIVRWFFEV